MISHPRPHFVFLLRLTSFLCILTLYVLCHNSTHSALSYFFAVNRSVRTSNTGTPILHSAFYQASSPFTSGSTSSRARMPTSIMESSGSKVVKFCSHRPGAVKTLVTGPSWRPAQRLNS